MDVKRTFNNKEIFLRKIKELDKKPSELKDLNIRVM